MLRVRAAYYVCAESIGTGMRRPPRYGSGDVGRLMRGVIAGQGVGVTELW
jgi:hypothetical protein